ncbi:MAG TPA: CDP-diacylglycerol--glycerol-3-phosphate 3-phosphatidyltransferase [Candidatus Kapabacteria bacterium]|nr:CDP-diacylglycerol--glycerol-3-phosphate 3-phosphatidyltransferase [Candidatus Kapabacteria bacterium]
MSYLPNILSILRLILSPIFFLLLISRDSNLIIIAYCLYVFGAITDYLDGFFARRYNSMSKFGNFFDPLADKFLTSFAFLAFANFQIINIWLVVIVIFRDLFTTLMRIYKFETKSGLITSKTAKWKTFLQMLFIFYVLTIILVYYSKCIDISYKLYRELLYSNYIDAMMLIITAVSVWTLIDYGVTFIAKPKATKKD